MIATAYRTIYGVLGAYVTARLAPSRPMKHALSLGAIGLAVSVLGTVVTWNNGPAFGPHWYPIALDVLAMPQSWLGGKLCEWQISGRQFALQCLAYGVRSAIAGSLAIHINQWSVLRMKKRTAIPRTVNEYLASVPEPARSTLKKVRAAIRSAAPAEATEVISYGMPMFKYKGMLIGIAAFTKHCSLFLATSSLLKRFKNELSGCQTSKGAIRFPADQPLPASLVKKIVKARVVQNDQKQDR
jgi:uncharacterized protein YdhG (YjbR/CyaY superfamily)